MTEQEENLLDALTEMNLVRDENAELRARVAELEQAGRELYLAGFWESRALSVGEQVRLWVKFREALGLPAGTATSQGKGAT